jgi:two-component system, OmpR family, sensor histidine kinase MprB
VSEQTAAAEEAPAKRSRVGWLNRMTLRGRLALMSAVAVTVAVLVCATVSWFFAKDQMISQVDATLQSSVNPNPVGTLNYVARACSKVDQEPVQNSTTLIMSTGTYCPTKSDSTVRPTASDYAIASSGTSGPDAQSSLRNGTTVGGASVRVYTVSVGSYNVNGTDMTLAIAVAQPLAPVQDALNKLALIMAAVSLLVIIGSAAAALWVARTALRPVDRLTEAVEHIARTEELGTTIAVSGKDEIARLSESFNSMSTALASSRDRQSQLIADAGHELRTPLTSLRTNVDLLVRSEETGRALPQATRTRMLGNMKAQMVELSTLIVDLLELSRPTRPKGSKPLEVLALHDTTARALDRARLRGPGLTFNVDLRPWYVRADAHAMERAVINLLDNAVKFSPPDASIDVALRFGTLTVRDHGPGIPPDDLPHVFDRFWRSPSARQMPGSGLGLAIVAQTIRDAGGEVTLTAADPKPDGTTGGALATVQLPGAPTPPPPTPPTVPAITADEEVSPGI